MEQTWNFSCPAKVGPALLLGGISCSCHSWTLVQFPLQCPSTPWTGSHQGLVRRFPVPHEMVWGLRFSLFWVVNFPPDSFQVAVASAGKRLRIYAEVSLSVLEKEEVAHPIILCFKHGPLLCSFNNLSMVVAHDVPSCKSVICNHSCIQENIKLWGIYEVYPQLLKRKQCHHNIFSPCNKNTISYLGPYLHQSLWWRDPSTSESWHIWWVLDCWWHPVSGVGSQLEQSLVFWQVCSPRHAVHRLLKLQLGWLAVSEFGWKTNRSTVMKLVEVSFISVIANIGVSRSTYTAKTLLFGPSESCSICRWGSDLRPESPLPSSSSLVARIHQ